MSIRLNRRIFLQSAVGGALGAAGSGLSLRALSKFNEALAEERRVPDGPEGWSLGVCSLCPGTCGLRVRTIGNRVVKIQGNPLHPVNRGGLCPKGIAGLQALYHPDRLRQPMKNVGGRESGRWQPISWEEAVSTVAARLRRLRAAGQEHTAVLIDRAHRNLSSRLLRRFMAAYGSPNCLEMPSGLDALQAAVYLQQGIRQPIAYDLERTRYLLSFGVNLLEGWGSPATVMRAFGRWRDSTGVRSKFVQIEPRYSVTAARADEWVPLRPGTEAALALGIAYVLISEGLYDTNFVRDHTFGFEDWTDGFGKTHIGFRSLVLSEYRLNDVSSFTEVPPETILRLAREFGRNRPSLALGDPQTSTLTGNPYAAMAVASLNALVGSVDTPGGALVQTELPWPEQDDAPAAAGKPSQPRLDEAPEHLFPRHHLSRLPRALFSGKPYAAQVLLLNEVNPVFTLPDGQAFREAFRRVPFIVSFTSFLDETSALGDLILPCPTGLERWQDAAAPPAFPYALQSVSPPVIGARHGTRDPADIFLELARLLGKPVATALPFANFEEYLRRQAEVLFAAQGLSVFSSSLEETWNRLLERSGWWAPSYSKPDELWQQMKEQGGCWDPTYYYGQWERVFHTPSGRFEFYSQALARWAREHPQFAAASGLKPDADHLFLPHQPVLEPAPAGYPLLLQVIEVLPLSGGEGAHLPYLQQIAGPHLFAQWESWLEINPETAKRFGIAEGDRVWVESRRGRAQVRARLYAGARPGIVHLPLGYGHTEGNEWGRRGANPLALLEQRYDPLAGLPQTGGTPVRVYRS